MGTPLLYASKRIERPGRVSVFSLVAMGLSLLTPAGLMWLALGQTHAQLCPGCGGRFTHAAIATAAVLLVICFVSLLRAVRLPASIASIILSSIATALAALVVVGGIGFYFAIQA